MTKTYAIILCGGTGTRFGEKIPKQFVEINGKTILDYTLTAFNNCQYIDNIIVVCITTHIKIAEKIANNYNKVLKIIPGGKTTRSQSSYNGVKSLNANINDKVLIHDGVRPVISEKIIENVVLALDKSNCVTNAIKTTDTLYEMNGDKVKNIPNRDNFVMAQTPQGFKYHTIKQAYNLFDNKLSFSDDVALVKYYLPNTQIKVIKGDKNNIKITNPADLQVAQKLLK